ncbi:DUF4328 domain-containing protein [Sphingomonas fuzhouensis]|uniref:DUF4328 domain-containing protein n=1 Tax=Sphingomonas fuzhouensis TaxID=3106033 RepID=UPI002AFFB462|nr:DUF4328 domain-containing protein [Sphingomonas sp. SGZ-02]
MLSNPRRLMQWTIALSCLWLLNSLGQAGIDVWQTSILGGFGSVPITPERVIRASEAVLPVQPLLVLLSILSHIGFFGWVYVINRNAQQWSDAMTIGPGWNVGWFFVPVASLWKPFDGIRESRNVSIALLTARPLIDIATYQSRRIAGEAFLSQEEGAALPS